MPLDFPVTVWPVPARAHGPTRTEPVTLIVLHATASANAASTIAWLNRPASRASYHYLIEGDANPERGRIIQTLDTNTIAWHAGVSQWPPDARMRTVNPFSVGVALVNPNDPSGQPPLTTWQLRAARWLCRTLLATHGLTPSAVRGHREVAPGRKTDPAPALLDLDQFRASIRDAL